MKYRIVEHRVPYGGLLETRFEVAECVRGAWTNSVRFDRLEDAQAYVKFYTENPDGKPVAL